MSREGAEHALRARADERDRISGDLLDLESHTTYQLLKGSSLRGATQRRWASAQAALAALWVLHDAYRGVLRDAERIRATRSRMGAEQLAELTALLAGPSVVLKAAAKPVEQRSLLPATDERLTLDQTVLRMDAAFQEATDALAEIDAAWSAALPGLDAAATDLRTVTGLRDRLGEPLDLDLTADELSRMRAAALEDPLGSPPAEHELNRITTLLARCRADLEQALRAREEYGRRREDLAAALDRVRAAESDARLAHGAVVVKIALPPQAAPRSAMSELTGELDALDVSTEGWLRRAARLTALERAAREAADQARTTAKALYGLVARRDELRGRLGACQAMAVRKGRAEDQEAARLYERARSLLWTAPCDLTKAAEAVALYQSSINGGGR
ncbi:hypothetical protein [Nonomuraea cavernae]|uniref:Uncharacterized protein n=1 Tax=Nonomuraea cavernae TaxID=2045107 RepID=A0A917YTY7_9ACTN|nr:hypothetical protein [Nonomuraea cavernae]MCA2185444.1 hypothetical protein [Nonomuraea cavernae]GGO66492.1 hypothetical protein GCM10012289_20640 [Nonomuraea cavernae]